MSQVDIIRASAGSGKTYRLALEYVKRVIEDPASFSGIVAVTFTNKATEEMKSRILKELYALQEDYGSPFMQELQDALWLTKEEVREAAKEALSRILHNYSFFSIYTIDRFFQKILRAFASELSLDGDYKVELEWSYLLEAAVDGLMDRAKDSEDISKWLREYTAERVASESGYQLDDAIVKVASKILDEQFDSEHLSRNREELVAYINELFAKGDMQQEQIRLKAIECKSVIDGAGLGVDDFTQKGRGFAAYIFRMASGQLGGYNSYVVKALDPDAKWGKGEAQSLKPMLQPLLIELCRMWDRDIRYLNSVDSIRRHWRTYIMLGDISTLLDEVSREKNTMLLSKSSKIISSLIDGNDAPFIYEKVGNRFDTYMVDEFQDTSLGQWNNFIPLMEDALAQGDDESHPLLFVGDVKQSIYGWRGGDLSILQSGVRESLGGSSSEINEETLPKNWRSGKAIVEFNNTFLSEAMLAMDRLLDKDIALEEYRSELPKIYSDICQQPSKVAGGRVEAHICDYEQGENLSLMLDHIKKLQDAGCRAGDIAILVRSNVHGQVVADFLLQQKSLEENSTYCLDIVSADALKVNGAAVTKFVMACMTRAIKECAISDAVIAGYLGLRDISVELEQLEAMRSLPPIEMFEELIIRYDLGKDEGGHAYLQSLYDLIIEFSFSELADLGEFVRWWSDAKSSKNITLPDGGDAINIITSHKSKGLEYKSVVIPFMNWSYSVKPEAVWASSVEGDFKALQTTLIHYSKELKDSCYDHTYHQLMLKSAIESFNILYVALTRACDSLFFTIPVKERGISKVVKEALFSDRVLALAFHYDDTSFTTSEQMPYFGSKKAGEVVKIPSFTGRDYREAIKIHLTVANDDRGALSPRAQGVLMHRLFEKSVTLEDITSGIIQMEVDGMISREQAALISENIRRQLERDPVKSWFDGDATVYIERDIIIPDAERRRGLFSRRPDRIILRDGRCTIVDYKFGKHHSKYSKQIEEYGALLESMGYQIEGGYLWYVTSGEIIKCI